MKNNFTPPKPPIRNQITRRSRLLFYAMCMLAVVFFARILYLQIYKKETLIKSVAKLKNRLEVIYADRGNIYATDGQSLLATTVPHYKVSFDATLPKDSIKVKRPSTGKKDSLVFFAKRLDSLALGLSKILKDRSKAEYYQLIMAARKRKDSHIFLINRLITVEERNELIKYPYFQPGSKGGILTPKNIREYPFGQMAKRTIGKVRTDTTMGQFGLEFSFDRFLAGRNGVGYFNHITSDHKQPVEASPELQPQQGDDIVTTIDVNLQDIAENALLEKLYETQARYGTVILMEIATGHIKAIANYGRQQAAEGLLYADDDNYAVKAGTDPGSTFKLASMVALFEKADIPLDSYVATCTGGVSHGPNYLRCSHSHGAVTARKTFELSCNVGIYAMMKKHFGFSRKSEFIEYVSKFHLKDPMNFQLKGEVTPRILEQGNFSNTSIPWTSIGYESRLSPLRMLAFYNAVANNGYWVKPMLVKEVRKENQVVAEFATEQKSDAFCSEKTIRLVKELMEGVVARGTADNIKEGYCQVAGKTGTAQKHIAGQNYQDGEAVYTSFIGYFPAKHPKYSCIVAIDDPKVGLSLYGNTIAAPVFRQIADKVFAYDVAMQPAQTARVSKRILAHQQRGGKGTDFMAINKGLNFTSKMPDLSRNWVFAQSEPQGSLRWQRVDEQQPLPNVLGFVLRDALYLLENKGFKVKFAGRGKVIAQSRQDENTVLLTLQ